MFARLLLTSCAVATLALAQGPGGGQMGPGGGPPSGGQMGSGGGMNGPIVYHKESKAELMVNRLKLDDDQKSEFNTIMQASQKDANAIVQQLLKSRQDLANAMLNGKTDAETAPITQALAEAQFQMTGVEVKAFQRIVGLLRPNQVAKAPEAFDIMADIFLPQGGGRGPGRGGQ